MSWRVYFPNENRSRNVAKNKVAEALHEPNIRQQVGDETEVFGLLNLHLLGG